MLAMDLSGKTALVTGGAKGIGLEISRFLGQAGARVAITGRDTVALDRAEEELVELCVPTSVHVVDMSDIEAVIKLPQTVAVAHGGLDILVNNAGMATPKPALEIDVNTWDEILSINLKGLFFCSQSSVKIMKERNFGRIVNISSVQSFVATRNSAPYVASKGGITMLTKALALEWSEFGINVNAVAPGSIRTNINRDYLKIAENLQRNLSKICLGRIGKPSEIAGAVVFLCSDYASYITGETLVVDGGWTIE